MKALTIFREGTHTDSSGQTLEFSGSALMGAAHAYDPELHEAPLVVGHPRDNAPAWGWVKRLETRGKELVAYADQIDPDFAELVRAGRYKKVSASFYLPASPQNPAPGNLYLRHVGFLGGVAPALKGLQPVEFGEAEGIVEFTADLPADALFADAGPKTGQTQGLPLQETLHHTQPVGAPLAGARQDLPAQEPRPEETSMTEVEQKLAEANAEITRLQAEAAARIVAEAHQKNVQFCEGLAHEGRIAPALAPVLVAALDALDGQPVNFGEGDAAKPLPLALREALEGLPKIIEFNEVAAARDTPAHASFAAPRGYNVDPIAAEAHAKAKAWQAAHPGTDYFAALSAVSAR